MAVPTSEPTKKIQASHLSGLLCVTRVTMGIPTAARMLPAGKRRFRVLCFKDKAGNGPSNHTLNSVLANQWVFSGPWLRRNSQKQSSETQVNKSSAVSAA